MGTEPQLDIVAKLMQFFEGFSEAFGTYDRAEQNPEKEGKLEIRATARTVRGHVTLEMWRDHYEGRRSLGIIPIRDNNTALWGAIDVDSYDMSYADILKQIEQANLPLVAARSKSGGVHLFLFVKDPVDAGVMQARLREMAVLLGLGSSEVFPKQKYVNWERGECGSWLNMPYFGGEETDRYGLKLPAGLGMTAGEFVRAIEKSRVESSYMEQSLRKKPKGDPDFGDGPPCLQHIAATGIPEGMRNNGMFAFATFAKKKYGSRWQQVVEDWNRRVANPPLPAQELLEIIKTVGRKDYNYRCRDQPLCGHCNSALCRTRKFGVGGEDDYPNLAGLSVLDTDPPLWFVNVNDVSLEVTTDELQNYRLFHRVCMERLFICYRMMKPDDWLRVVAMAMRDAVRIEAPEDVSRGGQFLQHLEEFVMNRHKGETREDLLVGRPWFDEETGHHYFRLRDLRKFLEVQGFTVFKDNQVVTRLRAMGGDSRQFTIKGKNTAVWSVPGNTFENAPELSLPALEEDPI